MARNLLCLARHFPPVAASGTHRTRAVVRHLPAHGWNPIVVTARLDRHLKEDPGLLIGLPEGLVVYRTPIPHLLDMGLACRRRWRHAFGRDGAPEARPG